MNYIVSLTTVPSKFDNLYITMDSIINQTILPSKIIINIPKIYNFRFDNLEIPMIKINNFINKYSKYNIFINLLNEDFGPGTKLLGLLKSDIISNMNVSVSDTYIILLDDDLIYKPYMIEYFNNYIKTNQGVDVASYFMTQGFGQGADGFFMKLDTLNNFVKYYDIIKNHDYINYQDDYYISYYFYLLNKRIHNINPPKNCLIYDLQRNSEIDPLNKIKGKYSRENLNIKVGEILKELNRNGEFSILQT